MATNKWYYISSGGVKLSYFDPDASGSKKGWYNLPIIDVLH
jgi:hypothetical protein